MKEWHVGPFGIRSPDGNVYGRGWTDEDVEIELIWPEMIDKPYILDDYKTYTSILDELGKGKPYSPEMMRSLDDPRLKQKLLEVVCKRSIK